MKKLLIISLFLISSINASDDYPKGSIVRPKKSVYNTPVTTLVKAFKILVIQSKIYRYFPKLILIDEELNTVSPYLRSLYRYLSTNKCMC
jgi:hypothetical protein